MKRCIAFPRGMIFLVLCCSSLPGKAQDASQDSRPISEQRAFRAFRKNILPLLTRETGGCLECHQTPATSPLVLSGDARSDFHRLLDERYLTSSEGDTLLGRITAKNPDLRMPKDAEPWSAADVNTLKRFLRKVNGLTPDAPADEAFPRALLAPYEGEAAPPPDNQFLTYRQLKGKIAVIFDDDWVRGDRDLFAENIALFGGADFKTRFNETQTPQASFLTGMEMLARDVTQRAYADRTGPFRDWPEAFLSPLELEAADERHAAAIQQLYRKILYRSAAPAEVDEAFRLIQDVHRLEETISSRDDQLAFELTVRDPGLALESRHTIEIPVSGERLEVAQRLIDQTLPAADAERHDAEAALGEFYLSPDRPGQRFVIHNAGTHRNVSFAGLTLRSVESGDAIKIQPDPTAMQVEGAWELEDDYGVASYEDKNRHKGLSYITVPLKVPAAATYAIALRWRADEGNAPNVLTEIFAAGAGNRLAAAAPDVGRTESGAPVFYYDCGNDTIPYFEAPAVFQFDEDSYVEISNRNTREAVTAAGIEFHEVGDAERHFFIDSLEAEGWESWTMIEDIRFDAYNAKGQRLTDGNEHKDKLSLKYRPATQRDRGWDPEKFYRVRIYYPGKRDQEPRVPVVVHARRSSPVIRLGRPILAKADAPLTLDASQTETAQQSRLEFSWRQLSGARVAGVEAATAQLAFTTPRPSTERVAWTALAAALLRHPDFVFTRPPSLSEEISEGDRASLQLMKIALDLAGRPPTEAELEELRAGATLESLVDRYLESPEFKDFYYHRIRLLLESQGTEIQDEPVRLWCYVAFEDRPLQEILTADYTVNANFQKQDRPAYHGKTGVLTTPGFIQGKPGLPHYNYAAQVSMLFLGYVYEVPPEIVEQREGITALGTTDPNSVCYSCHKVLTPLAFQRLNWTDDGLFRLQDENGRAIDATDRGAVEDYPFQGEGMEAFATQAARKERFIRTMIDTHVHFYFGRPMRRLEDERTLYKRLWDNVHQNDFKLRELIRAIVTSPEYLPSLNRSPPGSARR